MTNGTKQYDVAIVGAGPSGSTTAYRLAKAGARVLLLDRAKFPRVKPCGGGVTARCFEESPVDLTPVVEQWVSRVAFSFRLGAPFYYSYPKTLVYMTQRQKLDAYLVEQAVAAGAEFVDDCQTRSLTHESGRSRIETEQGEFEARIVVGADGANGIVARSAGLQPVVDPPVALEANFPYPKEGIPRYWAGLLALELGSMPGGYGWSFPKDDHLNVGCGGFHGVGGDLRDHLARLRSHYGLNDTPMENLRGHHLPTRTAGAPIMRDHVLLAGDAAGLVDPMSGEGIYAAFVSGRLAAGAIADYLEGRTNDLRAYDAAVEREIMPEIGAAELLRDAYHYTPGPCFFVMRHSEMFRRALCELITGEKSYADFVRRLKPVSPFLRFWAARGRAARAKQLAAVI